MIHKITSLLVLLFSFLSANAFDESVCDTYQNCLELSQRKWFGLSSGDERAQYNLAKILAAGVGVQKSLKDSFQWMEKAADQGYVSAQVSLGMYYVNGVGTKRDTAKGIKWFKKAAKSGNTTAMFHIGRVYFDSVGIDRDYKKAVKWFKKAAKHNDSGAKLYLAIAHLRGFGSLKKDIKKAMLLTTELATEGYADAMNTLGNIYSAGYYVEKDNKKAEYWYTKYLAKKYDRIAAQYLIEVRRKLAANVSFDPKPFGCVLLKDTYNTVKEKLVNSYPHKHFQLGTKTLTLRGSSSNVPHLKSAEFIFDSNDFLIAITADFRSMNAEEVINAIAKKYQLIEVKKNSFFKSHNGTEFASKNVTIKIFAGSIQNKVTYETTRYSQIILSVKNKKSSAQAKHLL